MSDRTLPRLVGATVAVGAFVVAALIGLSINGPTQEEELRAVQARHPGADVARVQGHCAVLYLVRRPDGAQLYTYVGLSDPFTCRMVLRDEPILFQKAVTP